MMEKRELGSAVSRGLRDRGGTVLVGAVGLLVGALIMNLTAPPGVEIVGVTQSDDGSASLASGDSFDGEVLDGDGRGTAGSGSGATSGSSGSSGSAGGAAGGDLAGTPGAGQIQEGGGPAPDGSTGPQVRGVTDSTVKIGFTFFNVGVYGVVPAYDVGPGPEKMRAVLERWRREGRTSVHGREIELVYTEFSITDDASQRAACLSLVEDHKVFAVAAPAGIYAGTDCVTKEKKTPLVQTASTNGTAEGVRERAPYFFMVAPDRSQTSRNWAHWAHERGLLEGKRIGFYHSESEDAELQENFIAELKKLGYGDQIEVEITVSDEDEVGPEDTVAVNQFRGAQVNLAILLLDGLRMENFMQQAESQGYRPQYIASDLGVTTDDTKTTTFPPAQWEGTYAMSSMLYGQRNARSLPSETQVCIDDYRAQGRDPQAGTAEYNYALMACQSLELVWQALDHAGRDLDVGSYIRGMEAVKDYPGAFSPPMSFAAGDHTGSSMQRTLQWHSSCTCYQPVTEFKPFYVP